MKNINTNMSVFIHIIIGKFNFIEADRLFHPVSPGCWRVWMDVVPSWDRRVALPCYSPTRTEIEGVIKTRWKLSVLFVEINMFS